MRDDAVPYFYYGPYPYGPDADDDTDFDCGFVPGHGCQLAGTEECDFDCPYSGRLHDHPDYPHVRINLAGYCISTINPDQLNLWGGFAAPPIQSNYEQEDDRP